MNGVISVFLLLFVISSEAYKALVVYPYPIRSVTSLGDGLVRHLLNAGHEVTFVTNYPKKNENHPKLRQIDISENAVLLQNDDHVNISKFLENTVDFSKKHKFFQDIGLNLAQMTLENKDFKSLLENTNERFDVVIADFFETELYIGLASLYDCPMVWFYSMGAHWPTIRQIDDPTNPAYSSDYFTTVQSPFGFIDRFMVLWEHLKWRYQKVFITMPKEEEAYKNILGPVFAKHGKNLPNYKDIIYNSSLMLSNEHYASGNIPKTPQNWKLVGGLHIEDPPVPLPKDLQKIMDDAKHGVIYFSMGSVWKSELMPKKLVDDLLRMFGELKETVIWKYEADLPSTPKNVHILKWAPQQSILAHPNCRIFITHGGLLSSTETIHFGIPTIGVPIYFDQFLNIENSVKKGYALKADLSYNLAKDLKTGIENLSNDPKYREKAKELSSIYHDRPVAPGKEAIHWIGHVIRSHGALHLRSPSLKAPFYQKMYLDIIGVVILMVYGLVFVFKRLFFRNKKSLETSKKAKRS